ncbi:leukocyte receptor cluster member 1 homolog [Microplitis mediator]|uniref:leukocyte receptor cluster member 1 homolog n=1 Tax=Microplitis mediator TaxID=375433 RepID=UPI0025570189|nr:leukocyte receptor cluster member 1 homolog [Microplitis mediator]
MNILPKKKWHVRTKENIARVRRDEAQAAEEEKARQARAQKAETEARINILRKQARSKYDGRPDEEDKVDDKEDKEDEPEVKEHINFFKDLEEGKVDHHKPNAEREAEKKAEKEKYEKQIGYLTYLGQNTNESTGSKSWYEELPRRLTDTDVKIEVQGDKKVRHDPMVVMKRYLSTMGSDPKPLASQGSSSRKRKLSGDDDSERLSKKHKKSKKSKKHKHDKDVEEIKSTRASVDIEKLRAERLMRERAEKLRTEALLAKVRGDPVPVVKVEKEVTQKTNKIKQKYNSQFCPEIARQNLVDTPRR